MYNQSKPIACLKCKPTIIFKKNSVVLIYLENFNLFKIGQHLVLGFNSILKGNQLLDYAQMTIPIRHETSSPNNL
jgi:hypothetical protein